MFDKIICLNQKSRPDRWKQAQSEFKRVGISADRFEAIEDSTPWKSFCMSQHAIIRQIAMYGYDSTLVLEDDVQFHRFKSLQFYMSQLPDDWDLFYLGANVREENPEKVSTNIRRLRNAWTTHAIAYKLKAAKHIAQQYHPDNGMYDDWLAREILPVMNCYICAPMVAYQRPVYSDLWGTDADYTGAFVDADRRMR